MIRRFLVQSKKHHQQCAYATLAIRAEDKNVWERRAPLVPKHVKEIVEKGHTVLVEPSTTRAFTDDEYVKAGAVISRDLSKVCATQM